MTDGIKNIEIYRKLKWQTHHTKSHKIQQSLWLSKHLWAVAQKTLLWEVLKWAFETEFVLNLAILKCHQQYNTSLDKSVVGYLTSQRQRILTR
jgi:recombinational DNA repair protein RecT